MNVRIFGAAALLTLCAQALGTVRVSQLFGDNMVLQAGTRTPVYGRAEPGEIVRVQMGLHTARALADRRGTWRIELDLSRSEVPLDLEISGATNALLFHDVLVGEVWICSGQSNMEWSHHDATVAGQLAPLVDAVRPRIRLFKVAHTIASVPREEVKGKWVVCEPDTANDFSMLAISFGARLQDRLGCAVGLIESDWGGTPAESWTPRSTLEDTPELQPLINSNAPVPTGAGNDTSAKHKKERSASVLYNGMIHPLLPFGFKGVAWYQGESNVGRARQYRTLFPSMIGAWRERAARSFPFVFVQLANFGARGYESANSDWAELREAQEAALQLPQTAMACAIDLGRGSQIHAIDRDSLGKRISWLALARAYDLDTPVGPSVKSIEAEGASLRIEFDGKANGLVARSFDGVSGFVIAGGDHVFHRAIARIENGSVVVYSPKVLSPVAVRYAWADNPDVSLYNSAGLPLAPFRTDDWEK